jgi:uncharacterized protein
VYGVPRDVMPESVTDSGDGVTQPGSDAELLLQRAYGSEDRAARFYADQMCDQLLPAMVEFVSRMEMLFLSTADARGECDSSLRAGPPGFIQVLDDRHLAYPEYRGNGVHASLANISENPHVGLLMVDFERDLIGLHVNGRARIVDDEIIRTLHPGLTQDDSRGRRADRWVVVEVAEAYIHCRKHIPRMARVHEQRAWGTDDPARKGGDYFGARQRARNGEPEPEIPVPAPAQPPAAEMPTGRVPVAEPPAVAEPSAVAEPPAVQGAVPELAGAGPSVDGAVLEVPVGELVAEAGTRVTGPSVGGPAAIRPAADALPGPAAAGVPGPAADALPGPAPDVLAGPAADVPVPASEPSDPPTAPFPALSESRRGGRRRFPSTTHLPAGAATARPLRASHDRLAYRDRRQPPRRIRWLSS